MKKIFVFILLFLFIPSIFAENITGTIGGSYWSMSQGRYELLTMKDPANENIKINGKNEISDIQINSAINNISDFKGNIKQKAIDCPELDYAKEMPSICDSYTYATETKVKSFIDNFSISSNKTPTNLGIDFEAINTGIQGIKSPYFSKIENKVIWNDSVFYIGQSGGKRLGFSKMPDKSILGIMKTYGGDNPAYWYFRLKINNSTILFQQADLIPYANLWYDGKTNENDFDKALLLAIKSGWKFKNKNFIKRFQTIIENFTKQEKILTKKYENKNISSNYKIENNFIKYYSEGMGDNQWIKTDFDPATFKTFGKGNYGADKYSAISDAIRIGGTDGNFSPLFNESSNYWKKKGSKDVYTFGYFNNEIIKIPTATTDTLKYQEMEFSNSKSLCKAIDSSSYYYTSYDKKYCYGKTANMEATKIVGNRK